MYWVDPDKDAIKRHQVCPNGVSHVVLVDYGLSFDARIGERREHRLETAGFRCSAATLHLIASPE